MTSSGMKRGLAATAVSALAVTGLPFMATSAHADALSDQAGGASEVVLHVPTGDASVKNDGVNTTVHLLANGGANVTQVQFRYSTDAGVTWTNIGSPVSRSNGAFSAEWTPPTAFYNLPVQVEAVALGSVGTPIDSDVNTVTPSSNVEAIDIANAPGSAIGVYLDADGDQLGAVSGTTSDVAEDPSLSFSTPYNANTTTEDVAGEPSGGVRSYSAPVDFSGYTWDDVDPKVNQAIVIAEAEGDDAEAVTLYKQTISQVSAVAVPTGPQAGDTSEVTVTVLDQNGKPVVGANVYQENPAEGPVETNSLGEAKFIVEDTNATGGTTFAYFVDEDNGGDYDAGDEFRRTVTVTDYAPVATTLAGDSHDGAAFDFDEVTADNGKGEGDITVTVKDQNGAPLEGAALAGKWTVTPFDTKVAPYTVNATFADADGDGIYTVAFPEGSEGTYKLNVWIERDGTPGETAGDLSMSPLTVKAGEAEIVWADDAVAQRQAGTTGEFDATMQLDDGTGLPGRNVSITWDQAEGGNAIVAANAAQPGETERTGDFSATSVTENDGSFGVAISDPAASPNVNELDGSLDAAGTATEGIGDSGAQADALNVDFLRTVAPAYIDTDWDELFAYATPGRPVNVHATVYNEDDIALTDVPVEVVTDHGFFTPYAATREDLQPATAPSEGAPYGVWENEGSTADETTDDEGHVAVTVAIERDADFDDDGKVDTTVSFDAGSVTETEEFTFETYTVPLNPGSVEVALADPQSVEVLPNAPTTEAVYYDLITRDQFGNRTKSAPEVSDDSAIADVYESEEYWDEPTALRLEPNPGSDYFDSFQGEWYDRISNGETVWSNFTAEVPALAARSDAPTDQKITAEWTEDQRTWHDFDADPAKESWGIDGEYGNFKTVEDTTDAIHWYEIDFAASSYSIDSGDPTRTVGDTVHTTFNAEDQMGEPIEDLHVEFFRTGPDDLQDGDGNGNWATNADGDATYIWQGAKAGTAVVTSVVRDYDGNLIPSAELSDKVTFEKVSPAKQTIAAGLSLKNQKDGDDVAKVNAPSAAKGATVKLYKVRKDGSRKLMATKTANKYGNAKFVVNDTRINKSTKYQARVAETAVTFGDWTPRRSIK